MPALKISSRLYSRNKYLFKFRRKDRLLDFNQVCGILMDMPELSIIIVHHRTPGFLKMCLDSVNKAAGNINFELTVVDSMMSRESRDIISERGRGAKVFGFKENLGFGRGVNIGIKNSSGKYILILNPDIIIKDDAIVRLIKFLNMHTDVGMIGPQLRNFNNTVQRSYFSYYKPMTILVRRSFLGGIKPFKKILDDFLMADTDPNKIQTPDWIMGSAMIVRRDAVNKVGLMDERFFMYFEDVDWARRFWHNGYKVVYYPGAVMYHYHQRESKSRLGIFDALFNQKTRWHIESAIKFFIKYRNLTQTR